MRYGPDDLNRRVEVAPPGSLARLALNPPLGGAPGGASIGVHVDDVLAEHARVTAVGGIDPGRAPSQVSGAPLPFSCGIPTGTSSGWSDRPGEVDPSGRRVARSEACRAGGGAVARRWEHGGMTGPTDWVSGERVFAPPSGVLDVDWLVPAVLDALPGATPAEARAAIVAAWAEHRAGTAADRTDPLRARAADVVAEAVRAFGA